MRAPKLFIIFCLLVIFSSPINAAFTATYVAASELLFKTGTFSGSLPFASTKLGAYIGTITFSPDGSKFFTPSITAVEGPLPFVVNGQTTTGTSATLFSLYSVYSAASTILKPLSVTTNGNVLLADISGNINMVTFIVDLYLLSEGESSIYIPGESYTLDTGPLLGTFKVAYGENSSAFDTKLKFLTAITPFVYGSPGTITILYENPNPVNYALTIIENQAFTLEDAFDTNASLIAKAELNVSNATPNTAGINIAFSDVLNNANFALHLDGNAQLYSIPYKLLFLNQEVVGNVPIPWENLSNGTYSQNISVTGIDPTTAGGAPSGSYSDVITVTITPI